MATATTAPPPGEEIRPTPLAEALSERYLSYALSTIMHRALPDARDGLKPVHRRILYGMRLLRLDPGAAFKKSAKIVGDVMGNYHPHGDSAIYDSLVRMAQDWSMRLPLVDGHAKVGGMKRQNLAGREREIEIRLLRHDANQPFDGDPLVPHLRTANPGLSRCRANACGQNADCR
jgi:topoisomerase-4 subunit A